ncbi:MAG TPA: FAD-dependent oxidoreductase [Pyrinomonadaceae bacterium]|nr:FAD-dependent oxidoreductase [Pyrinomonadaceae bacterium]
MVRNGYDVAVIGAGVFGAWTAYHFQRAGAKVALLDRHGPANSRASSGGESRIIRMGYGPDDLYTRSAQASLRLWLDFFDQIAPGQIAHDPLQRLFHRTGVLWLAREDDTYSEATLGTLQRNKVRFERLDQNALHRRYPQLEIGPTFWGLLEPDSGVLMARQSVRAVVSQAVKIGATYFREEVLAPAGKGKLKTISTTEGTTIEAGQFVFACGPWLPKVFPALIGNLIHVTRQEVFFLSLPTGRQASAWSTTPVWIDFNDLVYAMPDVDGRGFKIALDAHGPLFDPDEGERLPTAIGVAAMRRYLAERVPSLKDQPILEARVCQYENTSNGDFLIDLHPDFENVWLVGGGSGHGFKHGPVVGRYVKALIAGDGVVEPRFTLATKGTWRQRQVF